MSVGPLILDTRGWLYALAGDEAHAKALKDAPNGNAKASQPRRRYNSARYLAGEEPVQRLKARQNAPKLEKPSS